MGRHRKSKVHENTEPLTPIKDANLYHAPEGVIQVGAKDLMEMRLGWGKTVRTPPNDGDAGAA